MTPNTQIYPQESCFHAAYEVMIGGRVHYLHVITRVKEVYNRDVLGEIERVENKLFFLVDFYGWSIDDCDMIEAAKKYLGIQ